MRLARVPTLPRLRRRTRKQTMAILIDGYNLLHAAGIIPRDVGRGTLQRARQALLNWLVSSLEPHQVRETIVVFDAANPPPGRPRQFEHQGLTVLFSTEHENADAMLEDLIRQSSVPKRLVVVSSDHRVQRAAKRRRAKAIDSDVWYFGLREQQHVEALQPLPQAKPAAPLSAAEVQHWLDEFSELIDDLEQFDGVAGAPTPEARATRPRHPAATTEPPHDELPEPMAGATPVRDTSDSDLANPFPPGYGEDLLEPGIDLDE